MPRNTRNVWLEANIDGRASTLESGPVSRDGGLSATIWQREDGAISDHRVRIETRAYDGEITTDVWTARPVGAILSLTTHRDKPGAVVTLTVPGVAGVDPFYDEVAEQSAATLFFRTEAERDAFLSLLPAWREAQAEVSA